MEDKDQSKTIHNDGITLPEHDFDGLSKVISNSKPTLPGTENGFIPLNSFDLSKPYEEIAKHLENWEKRLDENSLQPDQIIAELKEAKQKLVEKHESDFEQRIRDLETSCQDRMDERKEHHAEVIRLKDDNINELRGRVEELKVENRDLEKQRDDERNRLLDELRQSNEQRIADLERYHQNELALTERFTQLMERKQEVDEQRIRDDKIAIERDRRNWYETIMTSIKDSSLAKLFK